MHCLREEAKGVFQREPGQVGPPDFAEIGWGGSRPPKPQRSRGFGGPGQSVDFQTDARPTAQRSGVTGSARRLVLRDPLPSAPGRQTARSLLGSRRGPCGVGRGPGRRIVADNLGAMSTWSSGLRRRGWVSIKAATGTQPHQEADGDIGEGETELDGIIAGVKGDDGQRGGRWRLVQPGADLLGRDQLHVFPRPATANAQRRGPTRTTRGHRRQPRIVPAGHDRLAVGLAVRMVGVAALGAGFGVAAWPDTRVDRLPSRCRRQRIRGDHLFEARQIHRSGV